MNPIRAALHNRQVVFVLTAFAVLLGVRALLTMPRREDPKITIRAGLITAVYPGATAQQVEAQVTKKIEQRLFRFAEVRKAKTVSTSRDGLAGGEPVVVAGQQRVREGARVVLSTDTTGTAGAALEAGGAR